MAAIKTATNLDAKKEVGKGNDLFGHTESADLHRLSLRVRQSQPAGEYPFSVIALLIATVFFNRMFIHSTAAMAMWILYLVALILSMGIKGLISYRGNIIKNAEIIILLEWKMNRATPAGKIVFESDCAKVSKNIFGS